MGGLAAVTLHQCHYMTDSYCVLTYLARRSTMNLLNRTEDGVFFSSAGSLELSKISLRFVRMTPKAQVVFRGTESHEVSCAAGGES